MDCHMWRIVWSLVQLDLGADRVVRGAVRCGATAGALALGDGPTPPTVVTVGARCACTLQPGGQPGFQRFGPRLASPAIPGPKC